MIQKVSEIKTFVVEYDAELTPEQVKGLVEAETGAKVLRVMEFDRSAKTLTQSRVYLDEYVEAVSAGMKAYAVVVFADVTKAFRDTIRKEEKRVAAIARERAEAESRAKVEAKKKALAEAEASAAKLRYDLGIPDQTQQADPTAAKS